MTIQKFARNVVALAVLVGLVTLGWGVYSYVRIAGMDDSNAEMGITDRQRALMNNKLFQLWRFVVLNLKILKAVDHSKRA